MADQGSLQAPPKPLTAGEPGRTGPERPARPEPAPQTRFTIEGLALGTSSSSVPGAEAEHDAEPMSWAEMHRQRQVQATGKHGLLVYGEHAI